MPGCIVGCQYMPSIEFFAHWMHHRTMTIEAHEHFQKRTWRNRTAIVGNEGPLHLSIPLKKGKHDKMPIREVEISYDEPWHRIHFQSIQSAYGKSPFFEELEPELKNLFGSHPDKLWDFNVALIDYFVQFISSDLQLHVSDTFRHGYGSDWTDLRSGIPAGVASCETSELPHYPQVQRIHKTHLPNLSILDLLCHMGPETITYLHMYVEKLY